jgi:hypothetical protein
MFLEVRIIPEQRLPSQRVKDIFVLKMKLETAVGVDQNVNSPKLIYFS